MKADTTTNELLGTFYGARHTPVPIAEIISDTGTDHSAGGSTPMPLLHGLISWPARAAH